MHRIAIDIVLVPDAYMSVECKRFNENLEYTGEDQIVLNNERIPHISLRMGVVNESDLNQILSKVADIDKFQLRARRVTQIDRKNRFTQYVEIEPKELIQILHNEVMTWPNILNTGVKEDQFAENNIDARTIEYVSNFELFSGKSFWPHITLGRGSTNSNLKLIEFSASLKVFQLGNHCTCVKELS